jgi:DNA-binding transcriptional ArsR family regulator
VEDVFRALADPSRRLLLDRLYERDGQSLVELSAALPEMTRFGVAKHLRLLAEADLVVTRRAGRVKLHYLNPVPIRLIHDRWISKYAEPWVSAMTALKTALEADGSEGGGAAAPAATAPPGRSAGRPDAGAD